MKVLSLCAVSLLLMDPASMPRDGDLHPPASPVNDGFTVDWFERRATDPPSGGIRGARRPSNLPANAAAKGLLWLASVQGSDGGWGQDGGGGSTLRLDQRLESNGNDVANTAVAALAFVRDGHSPVSGHYRQNVSRAVHFILRHVDAAPEDGLAVTSVTGTQIQRKLGPYIDTFLASMLLSELDGRMAPADDAWAHRALEKCVRKIQRHQQADGSWNLSGGWAPILGTSIASRSLNAARDKGVRVDDKVLARVNEYTSKSAVGPAAAPAAAGIALYAGAQALEQLSRTEKDRDRNRREIKAITGELSNASFVRGFGSMGGEEFFSYLNISDSLQRSGGEEWIRWNRQIKDTLVRLQNEEGSWAGHHCITGRVAVTGAAILTLTADRQAVARR